MYRAGKVVSKDKLLQVFNTYYGKKYFIESDKKSFELSCLDGKIRCYTAKDDGSGNFIIQQRHLFSIRFVKLLGGLTEINKDKSGVGSLLDICGAALLDGKISAYVARNTNGVVGIVPYGKDGEHIGAYDENNVEEGISLIKGMYKISFTLESIEQVATIDFDSDVIILDDRSTLNKAALIEMRRSLSDKYIFRALSGCTVYKEIS